MFEKFKKAFSAEGVIEAAKDMQQAKEEMEEAEKQLVEAHAKELETIEMLKNAAAERENKYKIK